MSTSSDLDFGGRITLEDGFSRVADRVSTRFNQLRSSFSSNIAGMGRSIVGLTGSLLGIGHLLSPMGLAFGIGMLGRAAIRSSSEMENLRIAFTTMLGNATDANTHLLKLQRFAVGKPFEFHDLVVASRNLQTFGFHVNEVQGLLQDFGDAAFNAGTGIRGVNAMVNVFGTIRATQKVTFGQLRQLVRAGVPAFDILRERLHLTDQQLQRIARSGIQGTVVIEALRAGMQQRFAGGMDRAAQTISARISDLNDVAGIFLSQVGDELRPTILGFLNELGRGITNTNFEVWARRTADALATMARVGRIVLAPLLGSFDDLGARWSRDQGRAARPLWLFLRNVRDVIQGVEALLSSEGTNGIGRIPASLQRVLIDRGLWPITVKIARWGDRMRAIVGGFIEGVVSEIKAMGAIVQWIGNRFGLFSGGLSLTHDQAVRLGRALVVVLAVMSTLRTLTIIYATVTTAASVAINLYRLATIGARIASQQFGLTQMRVALGLMRMQEILRAMQGYAGFTQMRVALGLMRVQELLPTIAGMTQMRVALALMRAQAIGAAIASRGLAIATQLATAAQWLFNVALNANPIGLVVVGIVLLAGATLLLIRYWDQIGAVFARHKAVIIATAIAFGPLIATTLLLLAIPVTIAYIVKHWERLTNSVRTGAGPILSTIGRIGHAFQLVFDFIAVAGYLAALAIGSVIAPLARWVIGAAKAIGHGIASVFMALGRGIVGVFVFTGRLLYALIGGFASVIWDALKWIGGKLALFASVAAQFLGGIAQVVWNAIAAAFPRIAAFIVQVGQILRGAGVAIYNAFARMFSVFGRFFGWVGGILAAIGSAVAGVFRAIGEAVMNFFDGLFTRIGAKFRSMAGELVSMFRALPAHLQPAGLSDSIARLDAFAQGGAQPGGEQPGAPAPTPGGPGVPQLIVQRTAAQARVGAAGANAPAPVAPITVQPSNVVVQIDGRAIATAVQRHNEDENLRRGGRGGED